MLLDVYGDHAASCPVSGRLKIRPRPVEKTWARVLRESGARVRENVRLRDTTLPNIDPSDGRHIEIVVTGLPLGRGVPVAVDATAFQHCAQTAPHAPAQTGKRAWLSRLQRLRNDARTTRSPAVQYLACARWPLRRGAGLTKRLWHFSMPPRL